MRGLTVLAVTESQVSGKISGVKTASAGEGAGILLCEERRKERPKRTEPFTQSERIRD